MKKETHPDYQQVLFIDSASGHRFVCGSTLKPKGTETFEGVEYPVSYLSISSSSHPFFTGSKQLVDSEGRVDKFKKRFGIKERKEVAVEAGASQDEQPKVVAEKQAAPSNPAPKKPEAKPAQAKAAPAKAAKKK